MCDTPLKPVVWIGPTRKDLKDFPRPVQRAVGLAHYAAQRGETPPDAKPLKDSAARECWRLSKITEATRIARFIRFGSPQKDIELIQARLTWGRAALYGQGYGALTMDPTHEPSSGNVFADLGFPHPDQELVKAKLTLQIHQILKHRRLTQTDAARLLGTTQAQVSALMRCRPVSISVGRLMEFLTVLGQDVEVTVKPSAGVGAGHMSVIAHQPG